MVHILGETSSIGDPPNGITWTRLDTNDWRAGEDQATLLFGTHDANSSNAQPTWSEARIPRYLAYPVPVEEKPPERVALVMRDYRSGGIIVMQRLVRVEGAQHV